MISVVAAYNLIAYIYLPKSLVLVAGKNIHKTIIVQFAPIVGLSFLYQERRLAQNCHIGGGGNSGSEK